MQFLNKNVSETQIKLKDRLWLYIFSYRYPNLDLTKKLDKILAKYPKNGRMDGYIGFGLGCIYAAAKEARQ